jgi:ABC-type amino acid transport substrate-binding protein
MKLIYKNFPIFFIRLLALLSVFTLSGCYKKNAQAPIIVATCADIEPYSLKNKDSYSGFEIEIMEHVGKILNRPIVFQETYHLDVIKKIKTKEIDCAIGCLSDKGNKDGEFSISYLDSTPHILMHNLSGAIQDFGKTISVLTYSNYEDIAKAIFSTNDALIKPLQSHAALVEDYFEKNSNFFITDKFHAREIQNKNRFHCTGNLPIEGRKIKIAIMMSNNSDLKKQIDDALIQIEKQHILDALRQKWNLPSESDLKTEVTKSLNKSL